MYVRLKNDLEQTIVIQQIGAVYEQTIVTTNVSIFSGEYIKENIIKASYNIIDLIEVGDYVNGCKVTHIGGTRYDEKDLHVYCDDSWNHTINKLLMISAKDIKSIVTKEQFNNMEYEIGE